MVCTMLMRPKVSQEILNESLSIVVFFLQMLSSLLGLLVLSPICLAMLLPNATRYLSSEEEGSTPDPNTFRWPKGNDGQPPEDRPPWSPNARSGPLQMPPTGQNWPPNGNMTDDTNDLRMFGSTDSPIAPVPDTAICDMLFNAPVPPPVDQIPFFCICSHCKGTVGPKGDRGDRGLPGMKTLLIFLQSLNSFIIVYLTHLTFTFIRGTWEPWEKRDDGIQRVSRIYGLPGDKG